MSSIYRPDSWVIVELKYNDSEERHRKVLASWYGGYGGSDRWKLSSGVTEIIEHEHHYEIHNESGSIYECGKHMRGMSGYTASVFNGFVRDLEGVGTIEVIEDENIHKQV